jgi:hypothetical protein
MVRRRTWLKFTREIHKGFGSGNGVASAHGEALVASPALVVVPWTQKLLQKPAKLVVRILDRARQWDIFRRLDKSKLPAAVKNEIKRDSEWKETAMDDFTEALAEAAAMEMNKRQINSANAHWITLGMSAGELALAHVTLCGRIDKLILADKLKPEENAPEKK